VVRQHAHIEIAVVLLASVAYIIDVGSLLTPREATVLKEILRKKKESKRTEHEKECYAGRVKKIRKERETAEKKLGKLPGAGSTESEKPISKPKKKKECGGKKGRGKHFLPVRNKE